VTSPGTFLRLRITVAAFLALLLAVVAQGSGAFRAYPVLPDMRLMG
jgi:hypothetical protein